MFIKTPLKALLPAKRIARVTVVFVAGFLCAPAQAECSRSDIDYYLDKGFTPEQVTTLCGEGKSSSRDEGGRYRAHDDPGERYAREFKQQRRKEEEVNFMKASISAWDIDITPAKLEYTRKFCLVAGKTPEVEGRTRVCPDVRYRIYFKDLEIGRYERKYFFLGRREIEVTGKVKRKMLHDLREYPSDLRRELLLSYKHASRGDGTSVPVRRDVPIQRVTEILRKYAHDATEEVKGASPRDK